jgi:hypothetical protein
MHFSIIIAANADDRSAHPLAEVQAEDIGIRIVPTFSHKNARIHSFNDIQWHLGIHDAETDRNQSSINWKATMQQHLMGYAYRASQSVIYHGNEDSQPDRSPRQCRQIWMLLK